VTDPALAEVRLRDEVCALEATFLPAAGMLCPSLRHRGEELLAQNKGVSAYVRSGKTMGIPLLYPWANRLGAFDYKVMGRAMTVPHDPALVALDGNGLPIHGVIGGRVEWELTGAPRDGAQSLAAQLRWDASRPELFEVFPFHHEALYEARLVDGRLEIAVTVHACGEDIVPVAFGFHPYLSLPGPPRERWHVELPQMRRLALDAQQIPLGPESTVPSRHFELAEHEFDDGFDEVAEAAHFSVAAEDLEFDVEFVEGYRCAQVYAPRGGQFICFEPMTAPADALRSGRSLRLLEPGERHRAVFAVCVRAL
jgi:aldose 1-epimerase